MTAARWRPRLARTRERRGAEFTPSVAEQIEILKAMARRKDAAARIAALKGRL